MPKEFKGTINLDIRDSKPDWDAFLADKAPKGSPNVLVVLYDDTGLAAWSPFGGRVEMPNLQRLGDHGRASLQWDTTALCPPTRSTFLTGRNHHQNGFASISESSTGFPGYSSHIPPEHAPMATVSATQAGVHSGSAKTTIRLSTNLRWVHRKRIGHSARATIASMALSVVRRTTGTQTWPRTTLTLTRLTALRMATIFQRILQIRQLHSSRTPNRRNRINPGTCGFAPGQIMPRITLRRNTSTSTRVNSTTAMRPTASGFCRG